MRQVGPDLAAGQRAAHRVAGAAVRDELRRPPLGVGSGGAADCSWASHHAWKSSGESAISVEPHVGMLQAAVLVALAAVDAGLVGLSQVTLVWPGIRSVLPASAGTQKEWITSARGSSRRTGSPTGMWISLAVVNWRDGSSLR